ncbi:MAG: ABC transporter substrate-binding protein [Clostridiaceae bacterium]
MNQKNKRLFLVWFCTMLLFVFAGCNTDKSKEEIKSGSEAKTVTITDNAGRTVEVPFPLERVVVASRYNNELIRACGAIDKVVGVDLNTAQDRAYWSNFDPNNTIGKGQNELNYEKIIELKPQALILPKNGSYKEAEEKLSQFDIKVIVISGYDTEDFENQIKNIGKIFDKKEEAEKFIACFREPLEYINKQLEGVEKRKVYWEDIKDYRTSFEGDYYYKMIELSGGENIFAGEQKAASSAEIDPEKVITKNPDVIVKTVTPKAALSGTGLYTAPTLEQMSQTIQDIKKRPGWDEITAVKNDNVYLMTQFGHGGASKLIGSVYLAKWIYPDKLQDLNPDEIFRKWLEDFQGFKYIDGHFYPAAKTK